MAENPLKAPLNIAGVWRCDTRCDLKKVDGIIRRGRFRSERASVSVSLPYKLATERMYSNNESFSQTKLKGMSGRGPEEKAGENQSITEKLEIRRCVHWPSNMAGFWISSVSFLPLMDAYGRGEWLPDCNDDAWWMAKGSRWLPTHWQTATVVITYEGVGEGWIIAHNNLNQPFQSRYFFLSVKLDNICEVYGYYIWTVWVKQILKALEISLLYDWTGPASTKWFVHTCAYVTRKISVFLVLLLAETLYDTDGRRWPSGLMCAPYTEALPPVMTPAYGHFMLVFSSSLLSTFLSSAILSN